MEFLRFWKTMSLSNRGGQSHTRCFQINVTLKLAFLRHRRLEVEEHSCHDSVQRAFPGPYGSLRRACGPFGTPPHPRAGSPGTHRRRRRGRRHATLGRGRRHATLSGHAPLGRPPAQIWEGFARKPVRRPTAASLPLLGVTSVLPETRALQATPKNMWIDLK